MHYFNTLELQGKNEDGDEFSPNTLHHILKHLWYLAHKATDFLWTLTGTPWEAETLHVAKPNSLEHVKLVRTIDKKS